MSEEKHGMAPGGARAEETAAEAKSAPAQAGQAQKAPAEPEAEQGQEAPVEPEAEQKQEAPAEPQAEQPQEAPAEPQAEQAPEVPTEPEAEQVQDAPAEPEAEQAQEAPAEPQTEQAQEMPTEPEAEQKQEVPTEPEAEQAQEAPAEPEAEQKQEVPTELEAEQPQEAPAEPQAEQAPEVPAKPQAKPAPEKEEMARRVMQAVQAVPPARAAHAPFEKTPQQRAAEFDAKADALGRQWGVPMQPAAQPPVPPSPAAPHAPAREARPATPKKRGGKGWLVWLAACLVLCAAGFAAGTQYAALRAVPASSLAPASTPQPTPTPDPDGPANPELWSLLLANTQNPLPDGYEPPQLTTIDAAGRQVDSRIADALQQMIAAAQEDGAHLVVTSAYRSYERQEELFVSMIREYLAMGYSNAEAYAATKRLRNVPGTSEHQTGLTVDIISQSYWQLDEGYAETYEAQWLKEHAAEYGFILRYPKDKTAITGTSFEPWHYRYVGVEDAQKIMAQGLCLEEYLAKVDSGVAAQVAAALQNAGVAGTDTETGAASGSAAPENAASGSAAPASGSQALSNGGAAAAGGNAPGA